VVYSQSSADTVHAALLKKAKRPLNKFFSNRPMVSMRRMQLGFAVLMFAALVGCEAKFAGTIAFRNASDAKIRVNVTGFVENPPCGNLIPNATKTSKLRPMTLPEKTVLLWRSPDQPGQETVISIPEDARKAMNGELLFEFGSDKKWSVKFQRVE